MAYTFQSRATADLIMLKASAEQILKLLDKPFGESGIISVEQIPQALELLDHAVAQDDARRKAMEESINDASEEVSEQAAEVSAELGAVSLRQRVLPFADMLQRSAVEGKPVTWTV